MSLRQYGTPAVANMPLDALPPTLSIQLRVNRRDLLLPDSHGQIWMQLVMASKQDDRLFRGKKPEVESQMLNILCLGSAPKFPISRLVTLWNNERWKSMITCWCETAVGRGSFNISIWEWMASRRIDDVSIALTWSVSTLKAYGWADTS